MTLYASSRIPTVGPLDLKSCTVAVRVIEEITVRIKAMECCLHRQDFCIAQKTDVTLLFTDVATADYTGATEITLTAWSGGLGGTAILTKTLTGGDITVPSDNVISCVLSNSDTDLSATAYDWELGIVSSGGERRVSAQGRLTVKDTGTWDA